MAQVSVDSGIALDGLDRILCDGPDSNIELLSGVQRAFFRSLPPCISPTHPL